MVNKASFAHLTTLAESPLDEKRLYAGSGDGLLHVTRDGGATWQRAVLPGLPDSAHVHQVVASPTDANVAFVACNRFFAGDYAPYVYKTTDGGAHWTSISANLPARGATWTIGVDEVDPNLLFVGTSNGVYFSNSPKVEWVKLSAGIPAAIQVMDLAIQRDEHDLVVSTYGRGVYILDDYTPLRSLELGIEGINTSSNSCQFGWSCLYLNTLSWQTPTMPLPNEINPQNAFERMFGDIGSAEERAARFKAKASILDSVISAASRLNGRLAPQDRSTVEEYLTNIREVESRIQASGQRADAVGETPDAPAGIPGSYDEHVRVMYELVALAWRADITRVTTFMNGVEASSIGYPQIGVPESHHIVSHHGGVTASIAKYAKINAYHLSLFADFVEKLRATPDGDGTLLDHSLVMYGSGMGNGDKHDQNMVPIVLAGAAAGRLKGGRNIATANQTPLANLIAGLGQVAGLDLGPLDNATGVVEL
jgi:hypothetical protein